LKCRSIGFAKINADLLAIDELKRDIEVFVLRVAGSFFYLGFPNITVEIFVYVPNALINCLFSTLDKHLNCTIRKVADKACQSVTIGYVMCSEPKAHILNAADKNYMFGSITCHILHVNLKRLFGQVDNTKADLSSPKRLI